MTFCLKEFTTSELLKNFKVSPTDCLDRSCAKKLVTFHCAFLFHIHCLS